MQDIRVHVIKFEEGPEKFNGSVSDWNLMLPEKVSDEDALRIGYVLEFDSGGDGELFKVRHWNRKIVGGPLTKKSEWTLELGASRRLSAAAVESIMDAYTPGTDLDDLFVEKLEYCLVHGHKAPERIDNTGLLRHAMSFEEAKMAVANFYSVGSDQVHIRIIG
ncbi:MULTISPECIES: hypothetical protein [unclassified Pseudomonas]|uniref:hypothetical protein n=1 Tax=unclassified Pseudomonas TaxID=196821 RepID=UPI00128E13F3|nr:MULTISPECIES: hypothetical protein [unclassified Pseudomonas]MPQ69532.1 hypothetical protein [Pseudomonas sp. MWU12-2323]